MTYKVLDRLVCVDVSTFIQLDLLDRGCLARRQVGSRFCNRHGDEAGDVADCFSLHWFYFRVSALKINNIAPDKGPFHPKSTGPSCSKLTTSLVNDSLNFTSSDTQIC